MKWNRKEIKPVLVFKSIKIYIVLIIYYKLLKSMFYF